MTFHRFITLAERATLQGFPAYYVLKDLGLPEEAAVHAFGNSMSVPVVASVLAVTLFGKIPDAELFDTE